MTVGIGENYIPAFVLVLTASQVACGLAATIPMLLGAVLQVAAPYLLGRVGSHRSWVVLCVTVQALTFLPLVAAAVVGAMPTTLVFAVIAIYWATGMGAGPAWNVWVGTLVPRRIRSRYFARRTLLCQVGIVAGFVLGGATLQWGKTAGVPLVAFAILFLIAAASRGLSAAFLARQSPAAATPPRNPLALVRLIRSFRDNADPRALLFLLAMQAAVQVAGPYFTPYMFVHLQLSYWGYVALVCAAYLAKVAILPMLGGVVQRLGPRRVLCLSGLGICPLPVLWMVSDHFGWLLIGQCYCGMVWAAYELATLLLFFEGIPAEKRVAVLTVFNLANAAAFFAGSILGGALLSAFGASPAGYAVLFAASTVARLASLALLVPMPVLALRKAWAGQRAAADGQPAPVAERAILQLKPPVSPGQIATATPALPPRAAPTPLAAPRADAKPAATLADAA